MSRILALLLTAATTLWTALPAPAQPAPAGIVERMQGNALAVNEAVPRVLAAGDPVHVGDVLSTGPAYRLEIRMSDDGIFVLGETAAFVIVDYTFGQAGENNRLLRVIQGAFVATSGALGPQVAETRMRVQTQAATIGIRGTTVWGGPARRCVPGRRPRRRRGRGRKRRRAGRTDRGTGNDAAARRRRADGADAVGSGQGRARATVAFGP